MVRLALTVLCTLGLLLHTKDAEAKTSRGVISGDSGSWLFLDKFCFDNGGFGSLTATFTSRTDSKVPAVLLLYSDEEISWKAVYQQELTCKRKSELAKNAPKQPGDEPNYLPNDTQTTKSFRSNSAVYIRQRWWYLVIANCASSFDVEYTLVWRNGESHFSYDEQGLKELYIAFAVLYALDSVAVAFLLRKMKRKNRLHLSLILMSVAHTIHFAACTVLMVHYLLYADNGTGVPALRIVGEAAFMIGTLGLMFCLFALAKGWNITTSKLNNKKWLLLVIVALWATYMSLFAAEAAADKAAVLYKYESIPGQIILALNLVALAIFWFFLLRSWAFDSSAKKKRFYLLFGFAYSLWFLSLPIVVVLAIKLQPWLRRISAEIVWIVSVSLGYGIMLVLARPAKLYEVYGATQTDRSIPSLNAMARIQPVALDQDEMAAVFTLDNW